MSRRNPNELPDEMGLEEYLEWFTRQNGKIALTDKRSHIENALHIQIRGRGLPEPECEYRFAAASVGFGKGVKQRLKDAGLKDWRFDFAYPPFLIGIECEGGIWSGGRHNRGSGYEEDCRKYNAAQALGWKVYRFTTGMIENGEASGFLEKVIPGINST